MLALFFDCFTQIRTLKEAFFEVNISHINTLLGPVQHSRLSWKVDLTDRFEK